MDIYLRHAMDPRIAIWNILHDGEITVVAMEDDALVMFISIPYLRERLAPLGDSFALRLFGFRSLAFANPDGKKKEFSVSDLAKCGIEILSTDSEVMPVKIYTTEGYLTIDFDRIEVALDTGRVIEYEEVEKACFAFWAEWKAKHNA